MGDELRQKLIEAARASEFIHYEDIAPLYGFDYDRDGDRAEVGRLLDAVSRVEHAGGRPMLSAVVVHKSGDQIPGSGFFRLARELGKFSRGDKVDYWAMEFREVCDYWSRQGGG